MNPIKFTAHGDPKGQPRPRAFSRGGMTRVYDPGTAEWWKSQIAVAAREHKPATPMEGPIYVALAFYFQRPKSHSGKNGLKPNAPIYHTGKPDADNLAKAVLDCLTQLHFWGDDAQVCSLEITKTYGQPGCEITIQQTKQHENRSN